MEAILILTSFPEEKGALRLAKQLIDQHKATDGAASNNRMDVFQEMRLAALLAKVSSGDASALPASRALRMATLDGAAALGLDGQIGSITPGNRADIICAVSLSSPETQPCFDPISHLAFVAGREHVSHVWD